MLNDPKFAKGMAGIHLLRWGNSMKNGDIVNFMGEFKIAYDVTDKSFRLMDIDDLNGLGCA